MFDSNPSFPTRPAIHKLAVFLPFLPLVSKIGPASLRRFMLSIIPSQSLRLLRNIVGVMESKAAALVRDKNQTIRQCVDAMERSNDIMSLLRAQSSLCVPLQ